MTELDTETMVARLNVVTRKLCDRAPNPDRWGLFTFEHWCKMLERRRDLTEKCPANMLRCVKAELRRRDAVARKELNDELSQSELINEINREEEPECRQLDPRKDAKRMTGADWVSYLIQNPKEWNLCDFSKLSGCDWTRLIRARREFYAFCNWELFTLDDWCDLLSARPGFAKLFEKA